MAHLVYPDLWHKQPLFLVHKTERIFNTLYKINTSILILDLCFNRPNLAYYNFRGLKLSGGEAYIVELRALDKEVTSLNPVGKQDTLAIFTVP